MEYAGYAIEVLFKVMGLASMRQLKWHDEITHSSMHETNIHG